MNGLFFKTQITGEIIEDDVFDVEPLAVITEPLNIGIQFYGDFTDESFSATAFLISDPEVWSVRLSDEVHSGMRFWFVLQDDFKGWLVGRIKRGCQFPDELAASIQLTDRGREVLNNQIEKSQSVEVDKTTGSKRRDGKRVVNT